jgi:ATP-binding cassette subfamily B protein
VAPLVRRRQALVDEREAAIARVSGHVADSLMNMETVRAFAAEDREAAEHRSGSPSSRRLAIRSWDYGNLRIDTLVAPMSVLTNALGLLLAVTLAGGHLGSRRSWWRSPTTPAPPGSCSSSTRSTAGWKAR